jgi:hypothetical protein
MKISDRAESVGRAIIGVLGASPTPEQQKEIQQVLEQALINAMLDQAERCSHVALEFCSPEVDTAQKVAAEIRNETAAMLANLSSLR